ncbi:MAG: type III-B CRISPR module RAMP protein Cmr6 [Verrucomicrobia bacterium]|nr:type III-B CRISPR module RAMP protein Cmr6 [Verrucomicrobiota bacterium]
MPILMANDTRAALQADARQCDSRSLCFDRLAEPDAKEKEREAFFIRACGKPAHEHKAKAWLPFVNSLETQQGGKSLFALLQARLILNASGGVMENAGLSLDRFGQPFIRGSAAKGCARRRAIQHLLDEREAGKSVPELVSLLVTLAFVFGWGKEDWKLKEDYRLAPRRNETDEMRRERWTQEWEAKRSDFAYACGDTLWPEVETAVRAELACRFLGRDDVSKRDWLALLGHFAGAVSFLPAYPLARECWAETPRQDLELDVLTCHHPLYYGPEPDQHREPDKWQRWQEHRSAPDTEEPKPVFFPTVAPGLVFVFCLIPSVRCATSHLDQARNWLADGLAELGLGGKTAAGYGWFDTSKEFQERVGESLDRVAKAKAAEQERRIEEQNVQRQAAERRRAAEETARLTAGMSVEEKTAFDIKHQWPLEKLKSAIERGKFGSLPPEQKIAIYSLLREGHGNLWADIKHAANSPDARKKDRERWAHTAQQLYQMAKERKEKMP